MAGVFAGVSMVAPILRVRDLGASVAWWREVLGIEPAFVGADGAHPVATFVVAGTTVSLWQLPPGQSRRPDDAERTTYLAAVTDADLEDLRRRLDDAGVVVTEVRSSDNVDFFWFYDPDGNRFELARPRTASWRERAGLG